MGRRRDSFLRGKQPLSEEEYLARIAATGENEQCLAVAIRCAVALLYKVEPDQIHLDDRFADLYRLRWYGWDQTEFILSLKELIRQEIAEELAQQIPRPPGWAFFVFRKKGYSTFGQWARDVLRCLIDHGIQYDSTRARLNRRVR